MPEHHFLNLGAGVQSTALYLMSIDGDEPEVPKFDAAIFADTQEEPGEVYRHLEWLEAQRGPTIIRTTAHRSCQPLEQVDLRPADEKSGQRHLFAGFQDECEGYCGN